MAVEACKPLGAPIVFVCSDSSLQWWKQGAASADLLECIPANQIDTFFQSHQDQFSPDAVYRAKTWGRFQTSYQLSFVDLGLMPLVEHEVGKSLETLIERNVSELKSRLRWTEISDQQGQWLLQTIFWLVSGKILHDKRVPKFVDLDLNNVGEVFSRLAEHYGTKPLAAGSAKKLEALSESAHTINQFSSLALTTTESLAYVYENALISKETRSSLGTHSTPSFLVDYVVGNLTDWIEDIPVSKRSVFEPACGHAAFLVSAMRSLTALLPSEQAMPKRRGPYLRSRLHGSEIDPFALELARLSLTLTDIPNPDGWDLKVQDMFLGNTLSEQASANTILLANPPFDNFSHEEQQKYRNHKSDVRFANKAAEMLWRTVTQLPEGGVFGVVLPQTLLHSTNARELREFLVSTYELREICLFPDGVFSFSDAESTVIVGRRKKTVGPNNIRYRHIRERELPAFRSDYTVSTSRDIPQSRFLHDAAHSLRIPDLEEIWDLFGENPILADIAVVGRGLEYHGRELPANSITYSEKCFPGGHRGFVHFNPGLHVHALPKPYWMNLNSTVIRRPLCGTTVKIPQVLLNAAPSSRSPWRLKALIDRQGHAVTGQFLAVRPKKSSYSLETLWALLNSPIANAYAYSHLGKRHNIVGDIRKIPVPKVDSFQKVDAVASAYLAAASTVADPAELQRLLFQVDSEVMKLYDLPLDIEKSLLTLFSGNERVGVPFTQTEYLPDELIGKVRFSDFLGYEKDWSITNHERCDLIERSISDKLNTQECARLDSLQAYADYHLDRVAPYPTRRLEELQDKLFLNSPQEGKSR
jgi:hypothetical protein